MDTVIKIYKYSTSFVSFGCVGLEEDEIWERQIAKKPDISEDPEYDVAYEITRLELGLENLAKAADLTYFDACEREDCKDKFDNDTRARDIIEAAKELALHTW
ncbi:hypothetical protein FPQ18DRAFT_392665 [Pyronema domesticum]|nr:hypothetical protein FPQ18DRAFT_392665 [Pyronema domesticum]